MTKREAERKLKNGYSRQLHFHDWQKKKFVPENNQAATACQLLNPTNKENSKISVM